MLLPKELGHAPAVGEDLAVLDGNDGVGGGLPPVQLPPPQRPIVTAIGKDEIPRQDFTVAFGRGGGGMFSRQHGPGKTPKNRGQGGGPPSSYN